jgi:hypothetical protein
MITENQHAANIKNGCSAEELLPVSLEDGSPVTATPWSSHGTRVGACATELTTVRSVGSMEKMCV